MKLQLLQSSPFDIDWFFFHIQDFKVYIVKAARFLTPSQTIAWVMNRPCIPAVFTLPMLWQYEITCTALKIQSQTQEVWHGNSRYDNNWSIINYVSVHGNLVYHFPKVVSCLEFLRRRLPGIKSIHISIHLLTSFASWCLHIQYLLHCSGTQETDGLKIYPVLSP